MTLGQRPSRRPVILSQVGLDLGLIVMFLKPIKQPNDPVERPHALFFGDAAQFVHGITEFNHLHHASKAWTDERQVALSLIHI